MYLLKFWNYITILFLCLNILNAEQYSSITLGPVTIQWLNLGTKTNFIATLNSTTLNINNAWLALGINSLSQMVNELILFNKEILFKSMFVCFLRVTPTQLFVETILFFRLFNTI